MIQYMEDDKKYKIELLNLIQKVSGDKKLLELFLEDLLTPQELKAFIMRWQLIKRLKNGQAQRSIAEELGVGVATVTRGARVLHNKNGGFSQVFKKIFNK